jgi:hypothetical protein
MYPDGEAVHHCEGMTCPFLVDTGESLVCGKTGIVVGTAMLASFDYINASSQYTTSVNARAPEAPGTPTGTVPEKKKNKRKQADDIFGECFRVVSQMTRSATVLAECRERVVKRCVDCCSMCLSGNHDVLSNNMKVEYICLAVLYLMREGLKVRGTVICPRAAFLADALPSLTSLTRYGYDKSRYTKASKFLLKSLDRIMHSKPLHQLHI